ncbi:MAG TPA: fatty acid desaturase [Thermoanaerobaculia bacterium]|jgi:fatty acid desaturase
MPQIDVQPRSDPDLAAALPPGRAPAVSPEQRAILRKLSRRSNGRAVLTLVLDWGAVLAVAAACEVFRSPWLYAVAAIVIARQMNALFELHHHAIHANLFSGKKWNSRLQLLYSLPLGVTVESDRDDHLDHHRTFNTVEKDYQTWGTGYGLDPARRHDRRYMVWFLCIRPFAGPLQIADLADAITTKRWRDAAYRNRVGGFWLGAVALLAAAGRPDLLLWYWLVPRFTVFPILFFWDDMIGHYNCPRTGTREMRGLWFRLFGAHGTSFHNVHHLYPAIPWFNMERATRLAIDEEQVDVSHGLVDSLRQLVAARD